jgi:hypothetical protein
MARPNAVQLSNLTAAWQIRGNFFAKPWQPPFRWKRAPPHDCREKILSCRKRKTRLDFARGSPQRNHMRLMLRPGLIRVMELKRLTRLRISPRTEWRSGRAARAHAR